VSTIYLRMSREKVRAAVRELPGIVAGNQPDPTGAVRELLEALGLQFLTLVKLAFVEKSSGGTDEAGIKWAPLKKETVAYSRKHPGRPKGRRPLLTAAQDERWRKLYAGAVRGLMAKGDSADEAKGHGAAYAWMVIKAEGGKTVLDVYGNVPVEILSDTGKLFTSIGFAVIGPGAVGVGTNDERAPTHHYGDPRRNIPQRPLWPEPEQVPQRWVDGIMETLSNGLDILLRRIFGR
jgi:hypothetical protein